MKTFFKSLIITLLIITIGFGAVTGFLIVKAHGQNPLDFLEEVSNSEDSIQFYLLGVDSLNSEDAESTRSDTIMMVNVDLKTPQVNIISVPRDTRTVIEGRKYKEKINHAYAYGGSELLISTLNNLLGTEIEHYITIDYKFVKEMVDNIGGVTVDVPMDMVYEDPTANPPLYINLKKGQQKLKGDEALQFLRFRKGYENQDLGRVAAQQQFMSAFIKELRNPLNFVKLPLILNSYNKNTQSSLSLSQVTKIGMSLRGFDSEHINTATLPGSPQDIQGVSYVVLHEEEAAELLRTMGFNE